ncbi:hypothetical protein [Streptomyces sp. HB2AG]|uniref:hypothetical protein n=1 Tax=Streptomyces sp. HB2AG TaxID=2983400 RepID=UPI0022A9FDC5|nr:hypothetical protein [Streptomyces sp. HB2AG]MCZ2524350.1 hypothetical protein [Streptomyces sp. HB2AG]
MLTLRLALGSRPPALLRRLLVAAASAGVGLLLLSAMGHALARPAEGAASAVRLLWCAVPLAAAVRLSLAVAHAEPPGRLHGALAAAGLLPARVPLLTAASAALSCALGSVAAGACLLYLRGHLAGVLGAPPAGWPAEAFGAGRPLPLAGAVTLLALTPAAAALTCAVALRTGPAAAPAPVPPAESAAAAGGRGTVSEGTEAASSGGAVASEVLLDTRTVPGHGGPGNGGREPDPGPDDTGAAVPAGLGRGVLLTALGLGVEVYAARWTEPAPGARLPLPGGLGTAAPVVAAGWALAVAGLVLACPALVHAAGRALELLRPGVARLVAGRGLQEEALRVGRPLGLLCASLCGAVAGVRLWTVAQERPPGPLAVLGAVLVAVCVLGTVLVALGECRHARRPSAAALAGLGTPPGVRRGVVALRVAATAGILLPVTAVVAVLAALPLDS